MVVGTAVARPGTVAYGQLEVPPGVDSGYSIPVVVVNGARPGPRVALIAGLHGAEFAGIVALQQLASQLNPADLSGSVIIVPVVNVAGFLQVSARVNPVDGKNMNRSFPGNPNGSQTERASNAVLKHIVDVSDFIIDYHGGDLDEDQQPYSYWIVTPDSRLNSIGWEMVEAFGLPYVIRFQMTDMSPEEAIMLPTQATALGKPTITVDAGRAGTFTAGDIKLLVDGTTRTLRRLNLLRKKGKELRSRQEIVTAHTITSPATGTFYPAVGRGDRVSKGVLLGHIADLYGRRVAEVRAPNDAVILYLNSTPSTIKGRQLFYLGFPYSEASRPERRAEVSSTRQESETPSPTSSFLREVARNDD